MPPIDLPHPPRRILIVKPSALGDIVHGLPVLRLLRRRWPGARIAWLVNAGFAGLLAGHPDLDEVIVFERRRLGSIPALARRLAGGGFDLALDLQGLFRSGWLAWQTGAAVRVGFAAAREGAGAFYTDSVPDRGENRHAVERNLDAAEALGCGRGPVEFDLGMSDVDQASADALVPAGPFAALLPGTNWATKRWPAEHFAALVGPLRDRFGLASVVAGAADAAALPGAVDLIGRTSLKQLVAVLGRASLVVANDSGPMHLAAALGRPLVVPFGPTHPARTGPYGRPECVLRLDLPCAPCYARSCVHQSCLRWLSPSAVLDHAGVQMGRAPDAKRADPK